ncbi:MAG: preprotein translocase subunit SecG [Planctomycetes bacterium]|nr:preprotein translocase subunit SecG [Planctomycetota bacterium]
MDLLITFLYILFVLAAIVLVVVILLQEGKGGGLTDALGASGQQTFGVGASGINKFTGYTGAIFLASALLIHMFNRISAENSIVKEFGVPVVAPVGDGGAPPADAGAPPAGGQPATPPQEQPK